MVPRPRCPPTATTTASGSRRPTSASRRRTSSSCGSPCRSSSAAHAVRRPSFCFSPTARCSPSPAPTTYRSRGRPTRPRPSRERPRTTALGSTRPANPARRPCRSATRSCFPVARAVNTTPLLADVACQPADRVGRRSVLRRHARARRSHAGDVSLRRGALRARSPQAQRHQARHGFGRLDAEPFVYGGSYTP